MQNPTHLGLEELKQLAKQSKARKNHEFDTDLRGTDMLFVMKHEEVDTLEEILLNVLAHEPVEPTKEQKQHLIKFIKYIQGVEV